MTPIRARLARACALALLLPLATPLRAQQGLPDADTVRRVIEAHPAIADARALAEAQGARAGAVRAGAAEFVLRLAPQQRQLRDTGLRFNEAQFAVERPLRGPGKARVDQALAEAQQRTARVSVADARHELARELLMQWFGAWRAQLEAGSQQLALEQAQALLRTARSRVRQGDAAPLDEQLALAEAERSRAASERTVAEARAALNALSGQFPGLDATPGADADALATALMAEPGSDAGLCREIVEGSHELRLAEAEAERLARAAERAALDTRPDPTLGAFAASERGGTERVLGLSLTVPIGGTARSLQSDAARAEAEAAQARVQRLRRRTEADCQAQAALLDGQWRAARTLQAAAAQQQAAAQRVTRAYALGEAGIAELLAARRADAELQRQAALAALDALQTRQRRDLDLHRFWDFED